MCLSLGQGHLELRGKIKENMKMKVKNLDHVKVSRNTEEWNQGKGTGHGHEE